MAKSNFTNYLYENVSASTVSVIPTAGKIDFENIHYSENTSINL